MHPDNFDTPSDLPRSGCGAGHAHLIADALAYDETCLVVLPRLRVVAALRSDGTCQVPHQADAACVAHRFESARGAIESFERLIEAALLARDFCERGLARRTPFD